MGDLYLFILHKEVSLPLLCQVTKGCIPVQEGTWLHHAGPSSISLKQQAKLLGLGLHFGFIAEKCLNL